MKLSQILPFHELFFDSTDPSQIPVDLNKFVCSAQITMRQIKQYYEFQQFQPQRNAL